MPIAVTGSIATDHLMHFPGKFSDSLLPDQLHRVSLSFLVDDLVVRRGGVAPNICFGMALLGLQPILVGAAGADFADYESWLTRHGVDCTKVHLCPDVQTARFVCTTDDEMNQIASFYAGAMARAREIEIEPIAARLRRARPGGDRRRRSGGAWSGTRRSAGSAATRSPPTRRSSWPGWTARTWSSLITGASVLFTNDYELGLLQSKTGWTEDKILQAVGYRVTTLGSQGCGDRRRRRQPAHRRRAAGEVQDRPDRGRRRVPGRVPGRQRLRPAAGALGPARVR